MSAHDLLASSPIRIFHEVAQSLRCLNEGAMRFALVLLTTPIPPHAVPAGHVIGVDGVRHLRFNVEGQTLQLPLSATADHALVDGEGSLIHLLNIDAADVFTVVPQLDRALRDVDEEGALCANYLHAVGVCAQAVLESFGQRGGFWSVDDIVRRAGYLLP